MRALAPAPVPLALVLGLLCSMPYAAAAETATVIEVQFTLLRVDAEGLAHEKRLELSTSDGGGASRLALGEQVPVQTTTFPASEGKSGWIPVSSYTYQRIGLDIRVMSQLLDSGDIRLRGSIDDTALRDEGRRGSERPAIRSLRHEFHTVVSPGEDRVLLRMQRTLLHADGVEDTPLVVRVSARPAS